MNYREIWKTLDYGNFTKFSQKFQKVLSEIPKNFCQKFHKVLLEAKIIEIQTEKSCSNSFQLSANLHHGTIHHETDYRNSITKSPQQWPLKSNLNHNTANYANDSLTRKLIHCRAIAHKQTNGWFFGISFLTVRPLGRSENESYHIKTVINVG